MRRADESGLTLPELLVVMLVFGLVAALATQATVMLASSVRSTQGTANATAQVRFALSSIERQVRSGDVLFSPAGEAGTGSCQAYGTTAGSCMRVYTHANGSGTCVQWQVIPDSTDPSSAVMRTRTFSPAWQTDGTIQAWQVVARGLQLPSATAPPFTLQGGSTPFAARLLDVTVTAPDTGQNGRLVSLTSSVAGRNTTYGYDTSLCFPAPA
jgi:prepilin-type N-terminal cleavage/methylation domain-containing protein